MRYPEPSNIATLQELSGNEWVAYSRNFGEVKTLTSLEVEVLGLCDGKRSELDIVRESGGRSAEDVSRSLDLLMAKGLLVNEALPEVTPGMVGAQVGDELVVYDAKASAAHKLSASVARVYNACVGRENRDVLKAELSASGGDGSEVLSGAVLELEAAGLIEVRPNNVSRRRFFSTGMKAAAAIGIASVLAPTAAHAASNCTDCVTVGDCGVANCGKCCDGTGFPATGCTGARVCTRANYTFAGPNIFSTDFNNECEDASLVNFFNDCDDICDDLGGVKLFGCCNFGSELPQPNQPLGGPCVACGNPSNQMCASGNHVCCPGGSINPGTCGVPNGGACGGPTDCCSGNCVSNVCAA